jgi:hypothetical protein
VSRSKAYPVVDGSPGSLAGRKAGDRVRLDLSTSQLVGADRGPKVPPPPCVVAETSGGILYVNRVGFRDWTEEQIEAWRRLDALEERLDWAVDLTPRPLGDITSGDVRRPEDGDPAAHHRAVAKERVRSAAEKKSKRREEGEQRARDEAHRARAGSPGTKTWIRRKGEGK